MGKVCGWDKVGGGLTGGQGRWVEVSKRVKGNNIVTSQMDPASKSSKNTKQ